MRIKRQFAKIATAAICNLCFITYGFAQTQEPEPAETEKLKQRITTLEEATKRLQNLKVSGYIQAQYQWAEEAGVVKVGGINTDLTKNFSRVGIRRGRIKFAYDEGIFGGVFQIDLTEKGFGLKDAYLSVKDPKWGTNMLKAGVFDRPFGNEICYSSSRRESTERSTLFQTLFPDERDMGASATLQASKASRWNFLKLEAGLFAGNGIKQEIDNKRDFIGHLSAAKNIGNEIKFGLGVSYYYGSVIQGTSKVYTMKAKSFVLSDNAGNKGKFSKREYVGFDAQFSIMSVLGLTQLRAEYILGTQPAGPASSRSPNGILFANLTDTYIRPFSGYYVIFVQDFGKLPLSAVLKYDSYDPNTKISKDEVGQTATGTNAVDLTQNTFGFGLLWRASNSIRLQAYYEVNKNETTASLPDFTKDIKNNVFTLRVQYKF